MGIRATVKSDLDTTPAQLLYGTALRLPGEVVSPSANTTITDYAAYASRLASHMKKAQPIPLREQNRTSYVPKGLDSCSHVFIRQDGVRRPLQQPYTGPFKVLRRSDRNFVLDCNGRRETVCIDRLKVAFVENQPLASSGVSNTPPSLPCTAPCGTQPPSVSPSQVSTAVTPRRGRNVRLPVRFADVR